MGKGFFISKPVGVVAIVLGAGAVATIIALSVVYSQEKEKNINNNVSPTNAATTTNVSPTDAANATTTAPVTTSGPANQPWDKYRLPKSLVPRSYNVTLRPRLKPDPNGLYIFTGTAELFCWVLGLLREGLNPRFVCVDRGVSRLSCLWTLVTGESTVEFECFEETNLILIHSNKLNYTTPEPHLAQLRAVGGAEAPSITKSWLYPKTQYMVLELGANLVKGSRYRLYTRFRGELADDLGGFYRSEYVENNVTKYV